MMGMYADRNLSKQGKRFTHGFLETVSAFADIVIFFKIGMSAFSTQIYDSDLHFGLASLFLCLAGRAFHIFPLSYVLNWSRVQKIPFNHQVIMWHSGLRGAIAFSLALGMETHQKKKIVFATMFIALSTVFGFGCTTSKMLKIMKVETGIDASDNSCFSIHGKKRKGLLHIHKSYLRPFLLKREVLEEKLEQKIADYHNDETITTLRRFHPELEISARGPVFGNNEENRFKALFDDLASGEHFNPGRRSKKGMKRPMGVREPPSPASSLRFHREEDSSGGGVNEKAPLLQAHEGSSSSTRSKSVDIRTMFDNPPVAIESLGKSEPTTLGYSGEVKTGVSTQYSDLEQENDIPQIVLPRKKKNMKGTSSGSSGETNENYSTFDE